MTILTLVTAVTYTTLSIERYLAVFYPYFYEMYITKLSLTIACSMSWIFIITLDIPLIILNKWILCAKILAYKGMIFAAVMVFYYVKILLHLRKIMRQTATLVEQLHVQDRENSHPVEARRDKVSGKSFLYILHTLWSLDYL